MIFEEFEHVLTYQNPIPFSPLKPELAHYRLRPIRADDLDSVMAIERCVYPFPWTRGMFEDCLHVNYCCWLAEDEVAIKAYGLLSVGAGECHVLNICVHPDCRGQGLGRYLLTHLLHLGRRHQATMAFLEVRVSNQIALQFYRQIGFNEIGMRRAYYPSHKGREDAILLARHL